MKLLIVDDQIYVAQGLRFGIDWKAEGFSEVFIALNALIGVMQQYRSEKALEALKDMSSPRTKVLRDATFQQIDSRELVVGDLVFLETGNIVPADLRLLETVSFKCEESTLSGESDSIEKDATLLYQEEKNPADSWTSRLTPSMPVKEVLSVAVAPNTPITVLRSSDV